MRKDRERSVGRECANLNAKQNGTRSRHRVCSCRTSVWWSGGGLRQISSFIERVATRRNVSYFRPRSVLAAPFGQQLEWKCPRSIIIGASNNSRDWHSERCMVSVWGKISCSGLLYGCCCFGIPESVFCSIPNGIFVFVKGFRSIRDTWFLEFEVWNKKKKITKVFVPMLRPWWRILAVFFNGFCK